MREDRGWIGWFREGGLVGDKASVGKRVVGKGMGLEGGGAIGRRSCRVSS